MLDFSPSAFLKLLQDAAKRIAKVSQESKLPIQEKEYLDVRYQFLRWSEGRKPECLFF